VLASLRRALSGLFVWLLPLVVVAEYAGTTFGNPIVATSALLALFLGVLWVSPPETDGKPPPRWLVWVGRVLGLGAVVAGLWLMAPWVMPLLDPKHWPMPPLGNYRQRELFIYAPVLAAYPVALGMALVRGRSSGRDVERLGLLIALVLLAHLIGKQRVQGLPVLPYGRADLDTLTLSAGVVLVALLFVPRVPPFVRVLALLGAGLGLRYVGLETWKIDPATRDMLPLVKSAQDAFFVGQNPYGLHQMQPGSVVPLTYLPGMWLVWGVPRLLGATDFRLMGLLADAAVVLGLFWAASGVRPAFRERAQGAATAFGAVWLFSPSMAWNGIYAEPHAWWLVLALVLATTLRKKWWAAAFFLGVAVATRHFAAVVAPFVIVALVRDRGWRGALPKLALTGVVASLLIVPFVYRNPDAFWFGTFRWLVEYGPVHEGWFWEKFGFSGPLYKADVQQWMPRAQLALPGLLLCVALLLRGRRAYVAPAGTAYVLFVMFNGIVWDSFYLGCALFAAFAAAGGHALAAPPRPTAPSRVGFRVAVAGVLLSALAAGWATWTLVVSQRKVGLAAAREHLASALKPGDVLVDRAEWNVAFVQGKPLFPIPPVPAAREALDPGLGPFGALAHPRAWFVLRSGRESELARELGALGTPVEDRRFGYYRVIARADLDVQHALTSLPGSEPPRSCRIGGVARNLIGLSPKRGMPATATWRGKLGKKLVIVGGFDDSAMAWGRSSARAELRVDGVSMGFLRMPNLPGTKLAVIATAHLGGGDHDIELTVTTRDAVQRVVCLDGWVLGER